MKILFWLPGGFWDNSIGGVESLAKTLALGLKNQGHQIYIISFETSFLPSKHMENIEGIHLIRIGHAQLNKVEQLQFLKKIYTTLMEIQPDILHIHYTANSNLIYYLFLSKYIKCPQVMTTHGLLCEEHFPIYQKIAAKMTHVFCVSNALSEVSLEIIKKNPITIYNGINCSHQAYHAPKDFKIIRFLCIGRLTHEKGYDLAIRAFCKVFSKFPNITLDIIGEGVEKDKLEQIALNHPNIRFLGALNHQESLHMITESHIILVPSRYESFGLVAIEAGMMGRPVIASQVGGLKEIVNTQTGVLVFPDNLDEWVKAMIYFIQHPQQIEVLGKYAYSWVRKHFSASNMINHYLNYYQQIWRTSHATRRQLLAQRRTTPALESSFS